MMEFSSPLATMQPRTLRYGTMGLEDNLGWRFPYEKSEHTFGPSSFNCSFNFEDLSMREPSKDYFNHKAVRGSSPTSTLVADLSQNLLIERSPRNPTPRRALFSTLHFGTRERTTTPPIPSSSPGPAHDAMDISPLPHKPPFASRTTSAPPVGDGGFAVPKEEPPPSGGPEQLPLPTGLPVRIRKPSLSRPSLLLTKAHSITADSIKSADTETQLHPFNFGSALPCPSPFGAEDGLVSLPTEEKRPQSAHSPMPTLMGPPRFKQPLQGLASQLRSGSPLAGHVRKSSAPGQRPRKQFRRSLSMVDNPADIMKESTTNYCIGLDPIKDVDDGPQLQLPHFKTDEETLPRISKETMIDVLDGKYDKSYQRAFIVDCRFEYEYEGGHIDGAINFNNKEDLATKLFEAENPESPNNSLLILHCEYSAHRAPIMAQFVRHRDRAINAHRYPSLSYPELYILDGGYSSFFSDHKFRCSPQQYVTMKEKEHIQARKRGLGRVKQERQKLNRAQTFAFGQHSQQIEDSPTAINRQCSTSIMAMDVVDSLDFMPPQSRRLASY